MTDLRRREVPLWLTFGAIAGGIAVGSVDGQRGIVAILAGFLAGLVPLLPFVLLGGLGAADALLLASIVVWEGWRFVLDATWWTAVAGGVLALVTRGRGQISLPYAPAIAAGTVLAFLTLPA
jgi:Flp pilus assembly protein protease CpaA